MDLIDASGVRRMFELAASRPNAISLTIGQPDFDVPEPCKAAAIRAIQDGHNSYTVTQGLPELRARIAKSLKHEFDWSPEVLVTSGTSGGILLAMFACLDPGDARTMGITNPKHMWKNAYLIVIQSANQNSTSWRILAKFSSPIHLLKPRTL